MCDHETYMRAAHRTLYIYRKKFSMRYMGFECASVLRIVCFMYLKFDLLPRLLVGRRRARERIYASRAKWLRGAVVSIWLF